MPSSINAPVAATPLQSQAQGKNWKGIAKDTAIFVAEATIPSVALYFAGEAVADYARNHGLHFLGNVRNPTARIPQPDRPEVKPLHFAGGAIDGHGRGEFGGAHGAPPHEFIGNERPPLIEIIAGNDANPNGPPRYHGAVRHGHGHKHDNGPAILIPIGRAAEAPPPMMAHGPMGDIDNGPAVMRPTPEMTHEQRVAHNERVIFTLSSSAAAGATFGMALGTAVPVIGTVGGAALGAAGGAVLGLIGSWVIVSNT